VNAPRTEHRRVGRFTLLRELGRGAQATVWLAHDERLQREVALKALSAASDVSTIDQWLHEARAVSRLSHPHLVPVFEADEHEGRPYLVFEYVPGPTLSAHLRERGGALPVREAVTLMLGVLDAIGCAHEQGIVHRDLKPSNVLIDAQGRARVMDFGIAARMADTREPGTICGTPGYIAPEAARGAAPQPAMDVFAAGVMLAEMIDGRRLIQERDPRRAVERVQNEDLEAPRHDARGEAVDEALRGVLQRTLARDPAARTRSAAVLRAALQQWLQGGAVAAAQEPEASAAAHTTLDFLLRRMKTRADFPALSDAVVRIQRVASSEHHNLSALADEILKDVALTNKLLRLVNSVHYRASAGAVGTVSRAVALVGFAGIRNMALSLVLLEHMQDKRHADQLKEEFLRALMAATLAQELSSTAREAEEGFLAAMFQNLGRLLVSFYFPQEAQQVRELAAGSVSSPDSPARRVLGLSLGEIGQGVAKAWGLPEALQRAMVTPEGAPPVRALEAAGALRQRWLGRMAAEVADAMLGGGERVSALVGATAERYAASLGVDAAQVQAAAESARERLSQLAQVMRIELGPKAPARSLLAVRVAAPTDTLDDHTLKATAPMPLDEATLALPPRRDAAQVADTLAQGVQDIAQHMVGESFQLNEVLRMVLETMMRALGLRRVVFCLRDPKSKRLTGRFGLGEGAAEVAAAISVPLSPLPGAPPDLFAAVCAKGADTLITDASQASIAASLPPWFRQQVRAPAFLLLPMVLRGATFALIYADQAQAGGIALGDKELALLRTLRNQGVMAFRQLG
jgi:serine/threonine protein kinase